jgi:hypothetical protein
MHAKGRISENIMYIEGLQMGCENRGDNIRREIRNVDRYATKNVTSVTGKSPDSSLPALADKAGSFHMEGEYMLLLGIPVPVRRPREFLPPS